MEMYKKIITWLITLVVSIAPSVSRSQDKLSENIKLNQIGFYPSTPKQAIVVGAKSDQFFILSNDFKDTVFHGFMKKVVRIVAQEAEPVKDQVGFSLVLEIL